MCYDFINPNYHLIIMNKNRKLWYVAAAYSHPDKQISLFRKKHQELVIGHLASLGIFCLDPLANHYVVETLKINGRTPLPTEFEFWNGFCHRSMDATDGIIVCDTIDGWKESLGVTAEIKYATECEKPILYYSNLRHLSDEELASLLR
jgi:hypothetical protein